MEKIGGVFIASVKGEVLYFSPERKQTSSTDFVEREECRTPERVIQ